MPSAQDDFAIRIERLRADLVEQGRRAQAMIERAFDAVYSKDADAAKLVVEADDAVDRADVEIERACVRLLDEATRTGAALGIEHVRAILTVVKVNNEIERAADAAVRIAEHVDVLTACRGEPPETFRVMTNSIVGIIRDINECYARLDSKLAMLVLQSEDAVETFKQAILRDLSEQIAAGSMTVDLAFALGQIAGQCVRISDNCTNIAEQVIYVATGAIVRHTDSGWVETDRPADEA